MHLRVGIFSNLSIGEQQALYDLKSDKTIVIKEADKGSAVVVWDREDCCAEAKGIKGCFRCGKSCCQVCSFMSEGNSFRCSVSGREYAINSSFTCDSSGVAYILGCKVCGKQYVVPLHQLESDLITISHLVGCFLRQNYLDILQRTTITDFRGYWYSDYR